MSVGKSLPNAPRTASPNHTNPPARHDHFQTLLDPAGTFHTRSTSSQTQSGVHHTVSPSAATIRCHECSLGSPAKGHVVPLLAESLPDARSRRCALVETALPFAESHK